MRRIHRLVISFADMVLFFLLFSSFSFFFFLFLSFCGRSSKFNVLLTTFDFVMRDKSKLSRISWNFLIIDEVGVSFFWTFFRRCF